MDSRVIELTAAAERYGNLNIRPCGTDFFPSDAFGGSSRAQGLGVPITLNVRGLSDPVKTDIPTDGATGKPRWLFRARSWVKQFVTFNHLVPGNTIVIARLGRRTYEIQPSNQGIELLKPKGPGPPCARVVPMQEQLALFEQPYVDLHKANGIKVSYPPVKDVTFAPGLQERVHRWFRLTPSYSPDLVRLLLNHLECHERTTVVDPFLGKGTTLIECKNFGFPGIGIEINPLLAEVSRLSLAWDFDLRGLRAAKARFVNDIAKEIGKHATCTCEEYCARNSVQLPIIHNVFRWWRNSVLRQLLIIRTLLKVRVPRQFRAPFWIALCGCALDSANVHRNHPTISFDDNHARDIDVLGDFEQKVDTILEDLAAVSGKSHGVQIDVFLGNSVKDLAKILRSNIDRVITSPPYPNRFSYIHTTRPQLYFMEVLHDVATATQIDMDAVGGTWGRATSVLMKGEIKPQKEIKDILDFRKELLKRSPLMCNYATKYFNDMFEHIMRLKTVARRGFRGAYVVGNSRLKNVDIPTELYLAKIFEKAKFKLDEIMFFRRRGGKKKLYECAVCVRR
jgi:hypothetical protein